MGPIQPWIVRAVCEMQGLPAGRAAPRGTPKRLPIRRQSSGCQRAVTFSNYVFGHNKHKIASKAAHRGRWGATTMWENSGQLAKAMHAPSARRAARGRVAHVHVPLWT